MGQYRERKVVVTVETVVTGGTHGECMDVVIDALRDGMDRSVQQRGQSQLPRIKGGYAGTRFTDVRVSDL